MKQVISVCPKPSLMVAPHAFRTRLITSGLSALPAPSSSRGGLGQLGQVGLDQHPPHCRRGAEGGDVVGLHDLHQRACVEPLVVEDEDGRLGEEGGEKVAPGVPAPAGGEMFRWTSPGRTPSHHIVKRWPTG